MEHLEQLRRFRCRLDAARWLVDLDEARAFLADRHMLTLTPDCSLPSLFGACEPVADPTARGFAKWPEDKWWWGGALADMDGCLKTKLHRGKMLLLDEVATAAFDPLCRSAWAAAEEGEHGPDAQRLVAFLEAAGPSLIDDVKRGTGLDTSAIRRVRTKLEVFGALVSRGVTLPAKSGGHRHASELARWPHEPAGTSTQGDAIATVVALAVAAAVVAPRIEVKRWFAWDIPDAVIERLIDGGRLTEPRPDWIAAAH